MKVALVHELLTMRGGAERELKVLAEMYPDAPIYTLLYNEKRLGDWFPRERVRVAKPPLPYSLLPAPFRHNHHLYLRAFPKMVEAWDFSEFDVVISVSSAFVHGIITNGAPKHLCYVNAPARYLWDRTFDVLERAGTGFLGPLRRRSLERTFHKLRIWDAEVAPRPDALLAASKDVQRRIELYWRRDSEVVYPPIDDFWLQHPGKRVTMERPDYFLVVSTLVPYKRIDIAIDACNALGIHLKVVGEGPDRRRLERRAGPTVEFYGFRQGEELADLYHNAMATIFPGEEDFGIVPLESMACGTPVVALRAGGALETIVEGKTGMLFDAPTAESLKQTLASFNPAKFSPDVCHARATEFSRRRFEQGIVSAVENLLKNT